MKSKLLGMLSAGLLALAPAVTFAGPLCSESFNLGVMGPPALQLIGNDFDSAGSYQDCYAFSLAGTANTFGFLFEFDGSARRDIDVLSIALYSGDSLLAEDMDPSSFSYGSLIAGSYALVIASEVSGLNGGFLGGGLVGYAGVFLTAAGSAPIPEPTTFALIGLGLLAFGGMRWAATLIRGNRLRSTARSGLEISGGQ